MLKLTPKQIEIIQRLGYNSPEAFLTHYPSRYEYLYPKPIDTWIPGELVIFSGPMASTFKTAYYNRRSRTSFSVYYDNSIVKAYLFNQPYYKAHSYTEHIVVVGVVQDNGSIIVRNISNQSLESMSGIVPIYATRSDISQKMIRALMNKILDATALETIVPHEFVEAYRLLDRRDALDIIHRPKSDEALQSAIRTLKYEEFLIYHLMNAMNAQDLSKGHDRNVSLSKMESRLDSLPFELTSGQSSALEEIVGDLNNNAQMNRLLQGDVGSGKTIVALIAAKLMIDKGYQVAFLVPTDILAHQHALACAQFFPNMKVGVLTSESTDKDQMIEDVRTGTLPFIIATHAIIQDTVAFQNLGLVIIDEQHRFGVDQRRKLINKGHHPDVLMLSATPIPRSLASSLYFDMDVSTIQTYPSFRKETETYYIKENSMRSILETLYKRLDEKDQIYIVCAAIVEGDRQSVRNVNDIYKQAQSLFEAYGVGLVHGQMDHDTRSRVMQDFNEGRIKVLVCTTIIEVGVDIHNANTMVIYNAEMFGIATLHQLRGRIGRGSVGGVCYLLSSNENPDTIERLDMVASTTDGFKLSLHDLRQRGMGDILGKRQSGLPHFLLGDIERDQKIVEQAKRDAQHIAKNDKDTDFIKIVNIAKRESLSYN